MSEEKKLHFINSPLFSNVLGVNQNNPELPSLTNPRFSNHWGTKSSLTPISRPESRSSQKFLAKSNFIVITVAKRKCHVSSLEFFYQDTVFIISDSKEANRFLFLNSFSAPKIYFFRSSADVFPPS